jgi:hypothetical protein
MNNSLETYVETIMCHLQNACFAFSTFLCFTFFYLSNILFLSDMENIATEITEQVFADTKKFCIICWWKTDGKLGISLKCNYATTFLN